jgi:two-component system, NarL family, sensor histidine kinase DesK
MRLPAGVIGVAFTPHRVSSCNAGGAAGKPHDGAAYRVCPGLKASVIYAEALTLSTRWLVVGRVLLWSTSLIILVAVPGFLAGVAPAARPGLIVAIVAFILVWTMYWWRAWTSKTAWFASVAVLFMVAVLGTLTALAPPGRDGLLLAGLAAGVGLGVRRAGVTVILIAILAGAIQLAHGAPLSAAGAALNDLIVGVMGIAGRLLVITSRQLEEARDEIVRLAVAEERLRLARDLHDLLGQDLTLAVLKSELVGRELPPETPPSARTAQLDVTAAVRKSLDDVRAVVAGYREVGISSELAAARSILDSAGIALTVEDSLGPLPSVQESVLAWALRESVTNVLRHSRAARCTVRLRHEDGSAVLDIEDDGRGGDPGSGGSGLKGIAERVAGVGGSFAASPGDGRGYRVHVSVPVMRA